MTTGGGPDPALMRQLFATMPVGVALFDRSMRLLEWNDAFRRFLEEHKPEMAQKVRPGAALAEVSPFATDRAEALFKLALAGEVVRRDGVPYEGPAGTTYWDIHLQPLIENGEVAGVVDTIMDATSRVRSAETLRQREGQFRRVFEEINDGIILNDFETGFVAEANPAVCRMHGYTHEEFVGIDPLKFIHPDYWDKLAEYQESVRAGKDYHIRAKDVRKDGTAFDVEVMGTAFELEGRKYLLAVVRDISEQVAREREQEEAQASLEQRVEERTRELGSLLDVSRAVLSTLDLDRLFIRVLEEIGNVIPYGGSSILEVDGGMLEIKASRNMFDQAVDPASRGMRFPVTAVPRLWQAMVEGRPALIDDVYGNTPEAAEYRGVAGENLTTIFRFVRAWMAVPLAHGGEVLGVLIISDPSPGSFSPAQAQLAAAFGNQVAVAIANARLYREVERRAREMEGLAGVAAALTFDAPAQETLNVLARRVVDASSAIACSITLFNERGDYVMAGHHGLPEGFTGAMVQAVEQGAPSVTMAAFRSGQRQVLRQSRTRTLNDSRYAPVHQMLAGARWETAVITPMVSRGRPQGTLDTYYPDNHDPDADELQLLGAMASQVAVAVENARLFAETQRRIREMDALYRVDEQLHQSLVLDEVLHALTDAATEVLDADRSAVLIFDENTRELRVRATSGLSNSQVQALVESLNGLDATTIEKLDVPRVVPDTARDFPLVQDVIRAVGLTSVIDVPITIAGKRFGLFSMGWVQHHDISPDEVRMASAIGQRAAVAIENARLYERAQHAASLEERQRLARELHDSVSQALYGISLGTRTARTLLERDPARVGEPLEYVSGLAEAGLAELRALIFELRPESLEAEGLVAAFEKQFAAMHARHGIDMVTSLEGEPDLRLDLKEVLYRIGQEAMHNTVKHARATRAWVTLATVDGRVVLEVRDNGVGFDPNGDFPGHLGLRSMAERATSSGGTLTIESEPGAGTTIRISVPAIPGHLPAGVGAPGG